MKSGKRMPSARWRKSKSENGMLRKKKPIGIILESPFAVGLALTDVVVAVVAVVAVVVGAVGSRMGEQVVWKLLPSPLSLPTLVTKQRCATLTLSSIHWGLIAAFVVS
jgi:hypothetical protein